MPAPQTSLSLRHALLALAVMAVWGTNFVVIRVGLDHLPPLLFACLRFTFALIPAVFFIKRPPIPWRYLIGYGLVLGVGLFGLIFIAMKGFITPGLASLVVQTQVFFTILLATYVNGDRVEPFQICALLLASSGIAIILMHTDGTTTPLGLVLVLGAALCWAVANVINRSTPNVDMLAYVVWASLFSAPPLFVLSLIFEGWPAIRDGLLGADAWTWAAVVWQSVGNVMFGYAVWGWLLSRYPAATIAPMPLLVPIFGMGTSALWLGEPLPGWKFIAAGLVLSGLALNLLWPRFAAVRGARHAPTG